MDRNWQHPDWPHLRYRPDLPTGREAEFLRGSGVVAGAARRDLADLVALGALVRTGQYKATRYAVSFVPIEA